MGYKTFSQRLHVLLLFHKNYEEFEWQKCFLSDLTLIELVWSRFLNQVELVGKRYGLPFNEYIHFQSKFDLLQRLLDLVVVSDVGFPFFYPLSQKLTGDHEPIESVSLELTVFMPKMIQEVCVDRSQSFHFQGFRVSLNSYFVVHSFCLEDQRVCL